MPGEEGYFGVMPGHAPMLAALKTGEMWYRKGSVREHAFIDGGFAEVLPTQVSILAQVAERAEDIDHARAFCKEFFDYYCHEHYHSGLGLHTPASVHFGTAEKIRASCSRDDCCVRGKPGAPP